ncbi:MAG: hypothetical protein V2A79_03625 [Planctomycetota bacterium]
MKRGFMLLEVVVAVSILVVGMAFIGMQIQNASRNAEQSERAMRALLLAESKFAEFDAGLIVPEEEIEEEFGPVFPDYGWRLRIEPTSTLELNLVTLEILQQVRQSVQEEFKFDEAAVVHRLFTLRATPRALDLTRDFGMSEEDADKLTGRWAPIGNGGIDPRNLDPARLFGDPEMDLTELLELALPLLEAYGMSLDDLIPMLPEELRQALEQAQAESEASGGTGGTGTGSPQGGTESGKDTGGTGGQPPRPQGGKKPRNPRTGS